MIAHIAPRPVRKLERANSSCAATIGVQESAETLRALDRAIVVFGDGSGVDQRVAESLMMTLSVVVFDELPNDQPKVSLSQWYVMVEAFASNRADEALSKGVEIRTSRRQLDEIHASVEQNGSEVLGEKRVSIVNEIAMLAEKAVERVCQVAGDLFEELTAGLRGDVGDLDAAGLKIHDEEDQVTDEPCASQDLDGEEVGRGDGAPMGLQEGVPGSGALGRGIDAIVFEYASNGAASDLVAEARQRTSDSGVAPTGILAREFQNEPFDFVPNARSSRSSLGGAIVLSCDEAPIPAHQSVGSDHAR